MSVRRRITRARVRHSFDWFSNNRVLCDVLSDMRKCFETSNFSVLAGLIEEAQIMGNRMESALSDQRDLVQLQVKTAEARRAYKKLQREYSKLADKAKLEKQSDTD